MHTFDEYAPGSAGAMAELIRAHPFALLISAGSDAPIATHLPVVPAPGHLVPANSSSGGSDSFVGATLWGHLARANPHWQELTADRPVLIVFQGASSYVSAALYDRTPAVPTWNYSAVHVTALPTVLTDPAATLAVLTETVTAAEAREPVQWDMTSSVDHFVRIQGGVVAFELAVIAVQGVFKLSQDKSGASWARVHDGLAARPSTLSQQVAADMAAARVHGPMDR